MAIVMPTFSSFAFVTSNQRSQAAGGWRRYEIRLVYNVQSTIVILWEVISSAGLSGRVGKIIHPEIVRLIFPLCSKGLSHLFSIHPWMGRSRDHGTARIGMKS